MLFCFEGTCDVAEGLVTIEVSSAMIPSLVVFGSVLSFTARPTNGPRSEGFGKEGDIELMVGIRPDESPEVAVKEKVKDCLAPLELGRPAVFPAVASAVLMVMIPLASLIPLDNSVVRANRWRWRKGRAYAAWTSKQPSKLVRTGRMSRIEVVWLVVA